jgi:hypothetical protein
VATIACRRDAPRASDTLRESTPRSLDSSATRVGTSVAAAPDSARRADTSTSADTTARRSEAIDSTKAPPAALQIDRDPATDSLMATGSLEARLQPLAASLDSVIGVLRADSGRARADSAFVRFRDAFERSVAQTVRTFDGPEFQQIMYTHLAYLAYGPNGVSPASNAAQVDSLVAVLRGYAIRSYQAEGTAYFTPDDDALHHRMGSFLTAPMQEYLGLRIVEHKRPLGGDGAISISWDELSDRLAATDRLRANHPDIAARAALNDLYRSYLGLYLAGGPNTTTFQHGTRVLEPAVRRSYERYLVKHASAPSAAIVREYLTLLGTTGYRPLPPVVAFIRERSGFVIRPAR